MFDVIALGELLIDFTSGPAGTGEVPVFAANPGGAPCNVLAMLARLGRSTAFVGKVGDDLFGRLLRQTLAQVGIGDAGLVLDPAAHTTLAFVHNAPDGDRSFTFYRDPGADELLRPEELPAQALGQTRILHFGSLSLTREPARSATRTAVELARAGGALVSFDPNLRPALWPDLEAARDQMRWGCSVCDILKVAEEELELLTGCRDTEQGAARLRTDFPNLQLLLVTSGGGGSRAFRGDCAVFQPAYRQVEAIDTTGAGDTFCGCCLHAVLDHGLDGLDGEKLNEMLRFANAAAGLVTTKKGAIRSMPDPKDIRRLMDEGPGGGAVQ